MEKMNGHFLQSDEWEKYEKLEGKKTFRISGADFSGMATLNETPLGNYLYLPYGPVLESEKAFSHALKALKKLAEEQSAYVIRIEPTIALKPAKIASEAKKLGMTSKKSHDLDPQYTWFLGLTASEEEILKGMESRKVRYWRNAEKKGITIRTTKDPEEITILTDFLKTLGEKDSFTPQDENHLKNQLKAGFATLYVAEYKDPGSDFNGPIAAALVYDYEDTRFYAHAATDFEHRKFQAGSILLIQMILDAKKAGKKIYDFWGITKSEDPKHPWYHFTQYKKSFGGYEVEYSGTYDIILSPVKYRLYEMLRSANRAVRKIKK